MVKGYRGLEGVSKPYTALRRELPDLERQGEAAYAKAYPVKVI